MVEGASSGPRFVGACGGPLFLVEVVVGSIRSPPRVVDYLEGNAACADALDVVDTLGRIGCLVVGTGAYCWDREVRGKLVPGPGRGIDTSVGKKSKSKVHVLPKKWCNTVLTILRRRMVVVPEGRRPSRTEPQSVQSYWLTQAVRAGRMCWIALD